MARQTRRTVTTDEARRELTITLVGNGAGFIRIMLGDTCIGEAKESARKGGAMLLLSAAIPTASLADLADVIPHYKGDHVWETATHQFETVAWKKGDPWTPQRAHEAATPIKNLKARNVTAALPADNVLAVLAQLTPADRAALREALK